MLLLLDLDNTVVDRAAAFADWARAYIDEVDGNPADLAWLLAADRNGYAPRRELAASLHNRFHGTDTVEQLVDRLMFEHVDFIAVYPGVRRRLEAFAAVGTSLVLVTNGTVAQQKLKLSTLGLDSLFTAVIISEAVGVAKPDPAIFNLAMSQGRGSVASTWMVGDHPVADMQGAHWIGLKTGWVSHRREWEQTWIPTVAAPTTCDVLDSISLSSHAH